MARCKGTTRSGEQCRREARSESRFCYVHEPKEEEQAEQVEAEATAEDGVEMEDLLPLILGLIAAGFLLWGMKWFGRWFPAP